MAHPKLVYMLDTLPTDHPVHKEHTEVMTALRRMAGGYPYVLADAGAVVRAKFNKCFNTSFPNSPFDKAVEQMHETLVERGHIDAPA